MKALRLVVIGLIAVVVIAVAWKTTRTRAFHQANQTIFAQSVTAAQGSAKPLASVQQPNASQPSTLAMAKPVAVAMEKETEERLGPFAISGNNCTVVLHKKHLAATEDTGAADGVVAMEIVDTAGSVLYRRTFPLEADPQSETFWRVFAHVLSGTNGKGLLVKSGPGIDESVPDPESKASYEQIFGFVNGKLVPFSGPFFATLEKPDASGVVRTEGALGSQADELRMALGTGRFVMIVPIRLDWAQGKLTLGPQCSETSAGGAHATCQYQIYDPSAYLQRPKAMTFVRLYSTPDEKSGRAERVVVKPVSQIEFLAYRADMVMKQPDASSPPSPTDWPLKDMLQVGIAPNTDAWLQVRIDGKVGWIHSDEDLAAVGLPQPPDEPDAR
jgi:hypothetical protein